MEKGFLFFVLIYVVWLTIQLPPLIARNRFTLFFPFCGSLLKDKDIGNRTVTNSKYKPQKWIVCDGLEFEQTLVIGDGQGSQFCCCPWDCKKSDTTELLNWESHAVVINNTEKSPVLFTQFPQWKKHVQNDLHYLNQGIDINTVKI